MFVYLAITGARVEVPSAITVVSEGEETRLLDSRGVIVAVFVLLAAIGPWIVPYPEDARGAVHLERKLAAPSAAHWFGTDEVGNDVYTRVILGARVGARWLRRIQPATARAIVIAILVLAGARSLSKGFGY